MTTNRKTFLWTVYTGCFSILLFAASPHVSAQKTVSVPPSVELHYAVKTNYAGLNIAGKSYIKWNNAQNHYSITTKAQAGITGTLLETGSKGKITSMGLRPEFFSEKRWRKKQTTNTFDYLNKTVFFSDSQESLPFEKTIQDQNSIIWQLISMARATPDKFRVGKTLHCMVTSRNSIDKLHFDVVKEEMIETPLGKIRTVLLRKQDSKGKITEVWLAPEKEWFPVKLNFDDKEKLQMEQTIQKIIPVAAQ